MEYLSKPTPVYVVEVAVEVTEATDRAEKVCEDGFTTAVVEDCVELDKDCEVEVLKDFCSKDVEVLVEALNEELTKFVEVELEEVDCVVLVVCVEDVVVDCLELPDNELLVEVLIEAILLADCEVLSEAIVLADCDVLTFKDWLKLLDADMDLLILSDVERLML